MNKEEKKCVIYIRVSTEMQVDGFSLDAQRNCLKKYAEREGMIIKDVYEDAGKSGKSIEGRPSFKRLLDDIKNGLEIDYVLVYKLSRFGRNAADILNSIEFIQSYDINLIATEEGIDSSQTSGKLLISVLSAVSEIERENILEQTMNGRREKARQGGWNGGFAPYGYEFKNGTFYVIEEEAQIVKEIFDMFVNENISFGKIAKRLNLLGKTKAIKKNRTLPNWSTDSIRNIITNPLYKGTIVFGRRKRVKIKGTRDDYQRIKSDDYICGQGMHDAIISEELWNQAQTKIEERSKKGQTPAYARTYLLSGLLRCPCCGGGISAVVNRKEINGKKYGTAYYKCRNAFNQTGHKCDYKVRFDMDKTDDFIINFVKEKINKGLFAEKIKAEFAHSIDVSNLLNDKNAYQNNLQQLISGKEALENKIDYLPLDTPHRDKKLKDFNKRLDDLYDAIDEIENNIRDIDKRIKGIESGSKNYDFIMANLEAFEMLFDKMTDVEKRKMITMIIKKINIDSKTNIISSIEFNFDLSSDNDADSDSISFTIGVENGIKALEFGQTQKETKVIREAPEYGEGRVIVNVEGKEVVAKKYPNGKYYIYKLINKEFKKNKATYEDITNYIKDKYGVIVTSPYIAAVKRAHGIKMQGSRNCNTALVCPEDKIKYIEDALVHFNIIDRDQA